MNIYYYLYFRLYQFAKKVGTVDATWTAMLLVSALLFFNVFSVLFFTFGVDWIKTFPKIIGAISIAFVGFFNYMIFIRKDRCLKIIEHFKKETKKQRVISSILTILYVVLTIFISHKKW